MTVIIFDLNTSGTASKFSFSQQLLLMMKE